MNNNSSYGEGANGNIENKAKKNRKVKIQSSSADSKPQKKSNTCDFCEKQFTSKGNLGIHTNAVHKGIKFQCDECPYSTGQKSGLVRHQLAIHGERTLACDVCGKKYKWQADLNRHKLKHAVSFECEICEKKFSEKRVLQAHKRSVHDQVVKRCQFDGCDFIARTQSSLISHMKIVHEEILFKCNICDYSSPRKGDLNRHVGEKHLKMKLHCLKCDYQCIRKSQLKAHIEKHHVNCATCGDFCEGDYHHRSCNIKVKQEVVDNKTASESQIELLPKSKPLFL